LRHSKYARPHEIRVLAGVEAGFILDEGKKVWDYIVANVDSARLQTRAF